MRRTSNIVRQLEWGLSFRNIHVKHVIVLDAVVNLFASGTNGIRHFPDLLPCGTGGRPLFHETIRTDLYQRYCQGNAPDMPLPFHYS